MRNWKSLIISAAGTIEAQLDAFKQRIDDRWGSEPLRIAAYAGFGTAARLALSGRVLEEPGLRAALATDSRWRNLANMYRRFESDEIPGARVLARFEGAECEVTADDEGFFAAELTPLRALPTNQLWHSVELTLLAPLRTGAGPVRASAPVLVPPPPSRFGVISDIDDTIIRTDATSLVGAFRSTLLGNARTRILFPGVAALYRALHGPALNPLFYVSSSPWNIYDMLADIFDLHDLPAGPLLLRNWGLAGKLELAFKHRDHKVAAITRILATYPALPFVLIGDSGQEDPEIYCEIVRSYPGRILAVYIRNVTPTLAQRTAAVQALALAAQAAGGALVLADDTLAAARHACAHGLISSTDLAAVAAAVSAG